MKEKFLEYGKLKIEAKMIKDRIEELAPELKAHMNSEEVDKLEADYGTFSLKPVPVWKFSDKVVALKEDIKEEEAKEKADGTAKSEDRVDLVFKPGKPKPKSSEE